jgi:16S rRNA (cytosine967-C5)-methyltransferase
MRLPSLLGHAAQLLRLVWNSPRPSDQLASEYFRAKKYIGAHDRRFISQTVFAALRGHSAFAYCAREAWNDLTAHHDIHTQLQQEAAHRKAKQAKSDDHDIPLEEFGIVAACCLIGNAVGVGNVSEWLEEMLGADATNVDERIIVIGENLAKHLSISREAGVMFANSICEYWSMLEDEINAILEEEIANGEPRFESLEFIATRFALPAWTMQAFERDWFTSIELAASLLYAAPLSLRVNPFAAERDHLIVLLKEQGIPAQAGRLSPDCILIDKRVNLTQTPLYRDGLIEIQDEASQLAAYAVSPEPGWRVLDACAGAGGKSLHLATLQRNKGEIIASDIEYERLKELPFRAKRAGLNAIHTVVITPSADSLPSELDHLQAACDAVLVDAPCSGMGTVRRSPMLKWRLNAEGLQKLAAKQLAILTAFAEAVKSGGLLVYATCSLMPQENERVVEQFLAAHPEFHPEPLAPVLAARGVSIPTLDSTSFSVTLLPSVHGSDGFFLARMRRV